MILELAGMRPLNRPMPGVVHPRRHLVGEEAAFMHEELKREHADVLDFFGETLRKRERRSFDSLGQRRGRQASRENPIPVPVLG